MHALQPGSTSIPSVAAAVGAAAGDLAAAPNARAARLIAILGHELRGRLAPAKACLELLTTTQLDAEKRRGAYAMIERQVDGMARLVDELLELARRGGETVPLRPETVSVAEIVERSTETVRSFIAARDHTLTVRIPAEPIFIEADTLWLPQALQNLLANAAKYTRPGGRVAIHAHREGNEAVLTVSDTGVGIEAAQLEAIFEPYVQLADAAAGLRNNNGCGLGLYVARQLIHAHGGTVRAASAGPGRGSELIVRLPCNAALER